LLEYKQKIFTCILDCTKYFLEQSRLVCLYSGVYKDRNNHPVRMQ
jgi:hypothetical protein